MHSPSHTAPLAGDESVPPPFLTAAAMSGGVKRAFFGDASSSPSSGSSTKRLRPSPLPSSPSAASTSSSAPDVVELLSSFFPHVHEQTVERASQCCKGDLGLAIRHLSSLPSAAEYGTPLSHQDEDGASTSSQLSPHQNEQKKNEMDSAIRNLDGLRLEQADSEQGPEAPAAFENYRLPFGVSYWVDVIAREINIDSDGRARLGNFLKKLEKLIKGGPDASEIYHNENLRLREKNEILVRCNKTLRKGVLSFAKYKNDFNGQSQEVEQLRVLVSKYEEEVRNLKMKIYELEIRLQKELQRSPIPDRFHPDVF